MPRQELPKNTDDAFFAYINTPKKLGAQITRRGYSMKRYHEHNHYEIINIDTSKKSEKIYISSKTYNLSHNRFFLLPPKTPHATSRTTYSKKILLSISQKLTDTILNFLQIDKKDFDSVNALDFTNEQVEALYSIGEQLVSEMHDTGTTYASGKICLLFAQFIDILTHPKSVPLPNPESGFIHISQLADYLKLNYAENINLDFLETKFAVNKFSLCKQFKQETGESIINFLTQIRINHARDFLENSVYPINTIAYKVGYDSPAYFSRVFKKVMGISPLEYRLDFEKNMNNNAGSQPEF